MKRKIFLFILLFFTINCGGGGGGGGSQETITNVEVNSSLDTNNNANETQHIPPPPPVEKTIYVIINPNRTWEDNYNATVKVFDLNSLSATICKKDTLEPLRFICSVLNLNTWYLAVGKLNNSIYLNLFSPIKTEEVELNQETTQKVLDKQIVEINNETIKIKNEMPLTDEEEQNNLTWNFLCNQ